MTAIESLLIRMDELLEPLVSSGDGRRHFLETYRRTTRAVAEELDAGGFVDPAWVERWDVAFADLYLDALEAFDAGRQPAEPWRVAFASARNTKLPPLRHVLLGMNAHINCDLPLALLAVVDDEEFANPEIVARRHRDHAHIDTVLLQRVSAEDEAITATSGRKKSLYERIKEPLERRGTQHFLRESRAKVWANTRLMASARARGDSAELERLRVELAGRSAAKLEQLTRAREVVLQLAVRGFGVLLAGAQVERR